MLHKRRLPQIKRFITQEDALLPTNIIVHLTDEVTCDTVRIPELRDENNRPITLTRGMDYELVTLNIPLAYASLELIDGQHRLYGFIGTGDEIRQNYNLVVLGMKGLPWERRRDTFVEINDKAQRVDPTLVAFLKHTDDETKCQGDNELMAIKVVVDLNKTTPFEDKIRLVDIFADQKITLKGFAGYDLKGLLARGGLLRKYYPNESKEYVGALRLYFGVLRSLFKEQWEHPEKYIIFTNRGISAFLKLLKSILKACQSPLTQEIVLKYLQPLRDNWADGQWETAQLKNAYVGAKGWKDFHRDLVKTIQERYPEFKE
jgi:DGQHR domain-containing protein